MLNILSIFWREYKSYFNGPIAYIVIAFFNILVSLLFVSKFNSFADMTFRAIGEAVRAQEIVPKFSINDIVIRRVFLDMRMISLFVLPMITMRLFAEEIKAGTLELLLTSPLTILQLVLGKFLAGLGLFLTMVLPTVTIHFYLFRYGNPDLGPILTSYGGIIFYSATIISIGLLISSLTENQIVAGALTYGVCFLLYLVGGISESPYGIWGKLAGYISVSAHYKNFTMGIIDSRDVLFFLSFIIFGLFLTYQSIASMRWR